VVVTAAPPLRVLHLTAGSDAGGLSRYILNLGTAMVAAGHTVAVAGERGTWHDLFAASPLAWIDVPLKGGPLALRGAARTLSRWLDEHPVDLLHVHYRRAALVGRLVQRRHPMPMLYTLHLSDIPVRWPWRLLSDFGDHTHSPSADAVPWLTGVARVPAERITVVPHGIDAARFPVPDEPMRAAARAALGFGSDDTVAAYVGRFDDPKNVDWLLDVATAVPALRLVIAGEGPHEAAVRARVAADRLSNVTLLVGRVAPVPVYHAADALLLPSGREGFSLVCGEAMSCGVAVLRTRTAGSTETIVEGVTGRSTPIDHDAFVSAAVAFLADRDALHRMGRAAASHVRERLMFDRQVGQTLELYRELIGRSDW
jgi:glycosyltransferase involved in cell wall biosynthesis